MNAELAIYLIQILNLFAFATMAVWFIVPRLRRMSRANALTALVAVHLGRTLCLQIYSSQDAGLTVSDTLRDHVVAGDMIGWLLALIILFCLRHGSRYSIALIWLLIVETFADLGADTFEGIREGLMGKASGTTWLIVAFYVPVVQVSLGLTIWQLLARRDEPLTS